MQLSLHPNYGHIRVDVSTSKKVSDPETNLPAVNLVYNYFTQMCSAFNDCSIEDPNSNLANFVHQWWSADYHQEADVFASLTKPYEMPAKDDLIPYEKMNDCEEQLDSFYSTIRKARDEELKIKKEKERKERFKE